MFPIPEESLTEIIESKLKTIKSNLDIIDRIFPNATIANRNRLKEYLRKNKLSVLRGYPRDIAQIPAYVIMLGGEREREGAIGTYLDEPYEVETSSEIEFQKVFNIGDNIHAIKIARRPLDSNIESLKELQIQCKDKVYDYTYLEVLDYKKGIIRIADEADVNVNDEVMVQYIRNAKGIEWEGTRMNSQYRIEVWTNNGDLTVLLYHLLRFIIISSRDELNNLQYLEQSVGGTDFEPLAEYFPEFVYRRILTLEFSYEVYYDKEFSFINEIIDISDYNMDD